MDDQFADGALNDASLYVPAYNTLDLIQGSGVKMVEDEFATHEKNTNKKNSHHIAFGGYYHKKMLFLPR